MLKEIIQIIKSMIITSAIVVLGYIVGYALVIYIL